MEQQESGVVGSGGRKGIQRYRWIILAAVVVLVLAALNYFVFLRKPTTDQSSKLEASRVCTDDINKQAAGYINGNTDSLDYTNLISKIKEDPAFDRDPNCLYIMLSYNLSKNISGGNDDYMARLEKVYNANQGFSREFGDTDSLQSLREQVASMNSLNKLHEEENQKIDKEDQETLKYVEDLDEPRQ